jgi:hypothetical protein
MPPCVKVMSILATWKLRSARSALRRRLAPALVARPRFWVVALSAVALDEPASSGILKSGTTGPDRLNAGAAEKVESFGARLVGEEYGKVHRWLVKAAVVIELADGQAQGIPAVRVLGFDEGAEFFDPHVGVESADLSGGHVALAPEVNSLGFHIVAVSENELMFSRLRRSRFAGWADQIALGVLPFNLCVVAARSDSCSPSFSIRT